MQQLQTEKVVEEVHEEEKGLGFQPLAYIFFDNPPRQGDPEVVQNAEIRFSTRETHSAHELVPLFPNPYAFFGVRMVQHKKELLWVIELNKYRMAKCGATELGEFSVEATVATLKTLQVTTALKEHFESWLEQEYVRKGTEEEEREIKLLREAFDARSLWLEDEAKKKQQKLPPQKQQSPAPDASDPSVLKVPAVACCNEILKETPRSMSFPDIVM